MWGSAMLLLVREKLCEPSLCASECVWPCALQPGNIFVTAQGSLKLGDLGLSRYFSSGTFQALTTGTCMDALITQRKSTALAHARARARRMHSCTCVQEALAYLLSCAHTH